MHVWSIDSDIFPRNTHSNEIFWCTESAYFATIYLPSLKPSIHRSTWSNTKTMLTFQFLEARMLVLLRLNHYYYALSVLWFKPTVCLTLPVSNVLPLKYYCLSFSVKKCFREALRNKSSQKTFAQSKTKTAFKGGIFRSGWIIWCAYATVIAFVHVRSSLLQVFGWESY